ncbi:MAG: DNA alkylation repair protein [Candidatus Thorarchaeota archaeon]
MASEILKQIHSDLKSKGNPERKEKIAGYLKTASLEFIGVELPVIHKIVKTNIQGMNLNDIPELMDALWKIETFETRCAAIDVMKVFARKGSIDEAMKIADCLLF